MSTIKRLEDLEAWQEARKLCQGVYELIRHFPVSERYNTVKHLRESSRGTMANIAEGFGRYFYKESMQFYDISQGCLSEVRSDLYLCLDQKYIDNITHNKFINQVDKVEAKINGLIIKTKQRIRK